MTDAVPEPTKQVVVERVSRLCEYWILREFSSEERIQR